MKALLFILLFWSINLVAQPVEENYPADPASSVNPEVPKGEILKFTFEGSKIYPGTVRDYWIYVPVQYQPDKPACVYVNQDGIQFNAPTVFDNLIHTKEMPVTVGVFVSPGIVRAANSETSLDRFNRSFEYDGLSNNYVRFILEEILPEVEKQKTANGRVIKLSKNGSDRAIGGSSSGAICAFTAAWERPDAFARVFSSIGTYVSLRGGDRYPGLIRKYEPKPIKIYLQDGSNDNNIYGGDWWKANEMMQRAFTFAGYDVQHVWGEGGHNGKHATAIFPAAMRWLWKDYPQQITAGKSKNPFLTDLLLPNQNWELVGEGYSFTEGIIANASGEVFFQDIPLSKTYKIDKSGDVKALNLHSKRSTGTAFSYDGKRYVAATETKQIICYDKDGKESIVSDSIAPNDLVVSKNGNVYVTSPEGSERPGKIFLITPNGKRTIVDTGLKYPNGLAFTPDQTQLYVTESASHWVWIYQISPDGSLINKQRYGWLHEPDVAENAWADGIKCDQQGRIYIATRLGVQIMDQTGRVNAILPIPQGTSGQVSNICFGGPDFNYLYATCADKVYRRKLNTRGANTFEDSIKPTKPKL